jgi:hypothetical protein
LTAYSLRITAHPSTATPAELEAATLGAPLVQGLSLWAEMCGPYGLSGWAEPRGHPLFYVDNCWVRAQVQGADVADFFRDVLNGQPTMGPEIKPDAHYLIEAEEF